MTHIAFASDEGFAARLAVSAASAVHAARGGGISVHVLDCGIGESSWREFENLVAKTSSAAGTAARVERHPVDMRLFAEAPTWTNGSRAAWARMLLPRILGDVGVCVYSDCDVLFIDDPSGIVSETEKGGFALAGHLNPFGDHGPDARWFRSRGLPFDAGSYVCSGLVGMDLAWMRENGTVDACWDFLRRFPDPVSVDQTVLNHVCAGRRGLLSDGWGAFTHEAYTDRFRLKAVHFSGGWPWAAAKNVYDAMCIRLAQEASGLWRLFESRVLGLPPSANPRPGALRRAGAGALLAACRLLDAANAAPSRLRCLLELVHGFSGPGTAIAEAGGRMLGG